MQDVLGISNMATEIVSIGDALRFISETDDQYGRAKGRVKALECLMKHTEAKEMMAAEGSAEIRKAKARSSKAYSDLVAEYEEVSYIECLLSVKRDTASLIIEAWRTKSANQRKGSL